MGPCNSRQWHDFSRMTQGQRRFTDAETKIFALDPLRLRFRDPETERDFVHETVHQSLNYIRAYLVAGFGLYGLFGILDVAVGGDDTGKLLLIRYGAVFPVFAAIFVATFFPVFVRHSQFFLGAIMVAAGFGVVAMTLIMSVPFKSQYYAGLVMVVIYCGNLIKLQYLNAALIACALVTSYLATSLWINPVPHFNQVTNNVFLVMATAIGLYSNYFQETYLRRAYVWQRVIRARNELTLNLLEKANTSRRARREFLATISHELRTPLNAIIGFSEILKGEVLGEIGSEKYASYAGDIHTSGKHLLEIIDEILHVARNDADEMNLEAEDMDLSEAVKATVRIFRVDAAARKIDILTSGGNQPIRILADEKRIRQILINLLSNALKFTPDEGRITITLSADTVFGISMAVSDTGIGIAASDIERALKPFEQISNPEASKTRGTGLGLSITEKLVALHGGALSIESAPGIGTTVLIRLPRTRLIDAAQRPPLKVAS